MVDRHDGRHRVLREPGARANGPLVELAVGNGRVDTSAAILAQARARAAEACVALDLREGDMRDLDLDEPTALIYCPFRALLHLPPWADRRRTFERVTASLRPGGRFAWNAFAFDHQLAARLDGEHQQKPVPHTSRYAAGDNRIDIILDTGATSSLWWATKNEWLGLIDVADLDLEALYAGFASEPLTDDSREYVFIARRPFSSTMPRHQPLQGSHRQRHLAASWPRRSDIPDRYRLADRHRTTRAERRVGARLFGPDCHV
jgi:SAM-dependent methyltransferase